MGLYGNSPDTDGTGPRQLRGNLFSETFAKKVFCLPKSFCQGWRCLSGENLYNHAKWMSQYSRLLVAIKGVSGRKNMVRRPKYKTDRFAWFC